MLLSRDGLAFIGHRIRMPAGLARWQMPQGGIDTGETPRQTALRELREEVGTGRAYILAESRSWFDPMYRRRLRKAGRSAKHRGLICSCTAVPGCRALPRRRR